MDKQYYIGMLKESTKIISNLNQEREKAVASLKELFKTIGAKDFYDRSGSFVVEDKNNSSDLLLAAREISPNLWVAKLNLRKKAAKTFLKQVNTIMASPCGKAFNDPSYWLIKEMGINYWPSSMGRNYISPSAGFKDERIIASTPINKEKPTVVPDWLVPVLESEYIAFAKEGGVVPKLILDKETNTGDIV